MSKLDKEAIVDAVVEKLEKAVTSDSAPAENGPENDEQLNGESKPTLQDAKSPQDVELEAKVEQQEVPENIDANQAEGGKTQEYDFGSFLNGEQYSLGSTLQQAPTGNVMTNMKQPQMDYVESAKNHNNVEMKPEDFEKKD